MNKLIKSIWAGIMQYVNRYYEETDHLADIKLQEQVKSGAIPEAKPKQDRNTVQVTSFNTPEVPDVDSLIEQELETTAETVKSNLTRLKRSKQKSITTRISDEDLELAVLCSKIDQTGKTWPDYDGSTEPDGDYIWPNDGWNPYGKRVTQ